MQSDAERVTNRARALLGDDVLIAVPMSGGSDPSGNAIDLGIVSAIAAIVVWLIALLRRRPVPGWQTFVLAVTPTELIKFSANPLRPTVPRKRITAMSADGGWRFGNAIGYRDFYIGDQRFWIAGRYEQDLRAVLRTRPTSTGT